jgi:quercetin dioxygenase-like cupin family protein
MLHVKNARIASQAVASIEGRRSKGIFYVKQLIQSQQMALLEVRVGSGVASAPHAHSHESLSYVISGKLRTSIGDDAFELGPGDVCRHPSGVSHTVEALQDSVFVEVKSPPTLQHVFEPVVAGKSQ